MINYFSKQILIKLAKITHTVSRFFNLGNGSTWPGHVALMIKPTIVGDIMSKSRTEVILIVGTNGKTTTATMLSTILKHAGNKVIHNTSGANLLNGIASTMLLHTNPKGILSADYAVFEVDENNLPIVLQHIQPKIIIALNLFRDQLDRYGELDTIARKWNAAFRHLSPKTTLVLNSDDPLIAYLAKDVVAPVVYFGLPKETKGQEVMEHAADSLYCPNCGHKLTYQKVFYSHLGIWECPSCGVKRPLPTLSDATSSLPGTYNIYNALAATLAAQTLGIGLPAITSALQTVQPAFGRQEVISYKGKNIQIFLSKNPTSFNESIKTITEINHSSVILNASEESHSKDGKQKFVERDPSTQQSFAQDDKSKKPTILVVLNDRIPDGRDISWIWDIDIENFTFQTVIVSGDRTYDMALRLAYASNTQYAIRNSFIIEQDLQKAIAKALEHLKPTDTLFILPTYSAMLDVRKILTGRKIR